MKFLQLVLNALFVTVLVLSQGLLAATFSTTDIQNNSSVTSDGSTATIQLVFTASSIPTTSLDPNSAIDLYYPQFDIVLSQNSSSPIAKQNPPTTAATSGVNNNYYWVFNSTPVLSNDPQGNSTLACDITIRDSAVQNATTVSISNLLSSNNGAVKVGIIFNNYNSASTTSYTAEALFGPTDIKKVTVKPNGVPSGLALANIDEGVSVSWTANAVPYTDPKINKIPATTNIFLVNRNAGVLRFAAHRCIESDTQDAIQCADTEQTECIFEYDSATGNCISCPQAESDEEDPLVFLTNQDNADRGFDADTVQYGIASSAAGAFPFTDLNVDDSYVAFIAYEGSVARTQCKEITVKQAYGLILANTEERGEKTDPRCFIATASFGNGYHPNVQAFRWFRDVVLLRLPGGKQLVERYYEVSAPIADDIAKSVVKRYFVSSLLWPFALVLHFARFCYEHLWLILMLAIGYIFFRRFWSIEA